MKLVFYSKVLNHHQVWLADEFYRLLGDDYAFVETANCMDNKGVSEDYSARPYLTRSWESKEAFENAMSLAWNAEVCVFSGYEALPFVRRRMIEGLLSFDMGERLLKRGWLNLVSPRILKFLFSYHLGGWSKKPLYKLCCGAFVKQDKYKLRTFQGKCFKWGYFIGLKELKKDRFRHHAFDESVSIMWCSRFLNWKHPEMAINLALKLKADGYNFHLDMYGDGKMKPTMQRLIDDSGLADYICLKGNLPNEEIQQAMINHDIFLFTSDQVEGWGVVANEAMSNKSCLVGSDKIGAVPYLVEDGLNGMLFKCKSLDSLFQKVKYLLDHPDERRKMAELGYLNMTGLWSPKHAAESLIALIRDIQNGHLSSMQEGPGSLA